MAGTVRSSNSLLLAGLLASGVLLSGCSGSEPAATPGDPQSDRASGAQRVLPPEADDATLAIIGTVTADSVRFVTDPIVQITFEGDAADTLRRTIRENIPEDVQPGQTYHNVRVHFILVSRLDSLLLFQRLNPDTTRGDTLQSPGENGGRP